MIPDLTKECEFEPNTTLLRQARKEGVVGKEDLQRVQRQKDKLSGSRKNEEISIFVAGNG